MPKLLGRTLCRRLQAARGLLPEDWQDTLRMYYQGCLLRPIVPHLVHTIVSPTDGTKFLHLRPNRATRGCRASTHSNGRQHP
jgi:hypothetical protein